MVMISVVPGTLGCLPCRPWCHRHRCNPAGHSEDPYCSLLDPRVQARRDKQGLVDWSVVRKGPRTLRNLPTRPRICGQGRRDVALEFGLLTGSHLVGHPGRPFVYPVVRSRPFHDAL